MFRLYVKTDGVLANKEAEFISMIQKLIDNHNCTTNSEFFKGVNNVKFIESGINILLEQLDLLNDIAINAETKSILTINRKLDAGTGTVYIELATILYNYEAYELHISK